MREIVQIPSQGGTLHGIVHAPSQPSTFRVGVVLFHENQNTKFGAHRLFRQLGDSLAEAGFYTLRYDDRGNCDSPGISTLAIQNRLEDARSALAFFRLQYRLNFVVGWGLCLGAAVALYCGAEAHSAQEKVDALILCNILADPARVSRPEWGYQKVDLLEVTKDVLKRGNFLRKILYLPRNFRAYRTKLGILAARYLHSQPKELIRLRNFIGRVGGLLHDYQGPCLILFSERDTYLTEFNERVNPGDKLQLKKKPIPPEWLLVKNGDHTFSSREKTNELISATIGWLEQFANVRLPARHRVAAAAQSGTSVAETV